MNPYAFEGINDDGTIKEQAFFIEVTLFTCMPEADKENKLGRFMAPSGQVALARAMDYLRDKVEYATWVKVGNYDGSEDTEGLLKP